MTVDISKIEVGDKVTIGPMEVSEIRKGVFVLKDGNVTWSYVRGERIADHIPAVYSWSKIEEQLVGCVAGSGGAPIDVATRIIALLNKIAPKGDA